ncbi:MAG: DNRLRE domain-containing protein [Verrucomicrobiaceae bacterium]|nr:MAG: DNRLRE domain-containing protein [Verrucomicrobiaceae bacterium]
MKPAIPTRTPMPLRAAALGLSLIASQAAHAQVQPSIPGTWTIDFEENFNGTTLDGTKWRMGTHHSGIAGSGGNAPGNISVSGGTLKLKAEQRPVTFGGTNYSYATGEVSTFANYRRQYGFFEARVKYPAVTGLWPAFWLMPDRGTYGDQVGTRRSYLKFDLTGSGISAVTSATLQVKVSSLEAGPTNNLMAFKTGDGWSESTITWNNKPVMDPVMLGQKYNNTVAVGDTITIDVMPYVAEQIAGDKVVSLVLADIYMRAKLLGFHSSEAGNAADRPTLVINGTAYTATEDATVRGGSAANTNLGNTTTLEVKDNWGNTADTFYGGMEVDILESLGIWGADQTSHAVHWDGYGTQHKARGWHDIHYPTSDDGFHTYGVYWQPGLLEFYVDGVRTGMMEDSRVMSTSAYMILSLQLGGWDNNNPGPQVNNQTMEVDWVRSWTGTRSAPTTVIADNATAADTFATGAWTTSSATGGYHGANYVHDGNTGKGTKSFNFFPNLTADDDYAIYGRWTSDPNRASNVPVRVLGSDWFVYPHTVNQRVNGGQWRLISGLPLSAANAEVAVGNDGTDGFVIADAFRFIPAGSKTGAVIVDDTDTSKIQLTGAWTTSSHTSGYIGTGYLHDGNTGKGTKSVKYMPQVPTTKDYFVYARWTSDGGRASNVPIDILTTAGVVTPLANQRIGGGEWNLLGVYPLAAGTGSITVRNTGTNGHVIADGVMIVPVP